MSNDYHKFRLERIDDPTDFGNRLPETDEPSLQGQSAVVVGQATFEKRVEPDAASGDAGAGGGVHRRRCFKNK